MFENLLHQERIKQTLTRDLHSGRLPHSMLFSGPAYSGKLTAALETARVLSCSDSQAPWSCTCQSCVQHRLLDSPYSLMLGSRYFSREIASCLRMLKFQDSQPLRFLFYRSVKKLIRRFDPLLWQDDSARLNKAAALVEKLEDLIEDLHPEKKQPADRKPAGKVPGLPDAAVLEGLVTELEKLLPQDGMSINMIRRMIYWVHTADSSRAKTIIIENAHEMSEAVRNAFLKVLEEPPESTYFILISSRPAGIIPTIKSRLREYQFASRGMNEQRDVISRIFRHQEPEDYRSLAGFLLDADGGGMEERRREVELMFLLLKERSINARDELATLLGTDRTQLQTLVSLCLEEIQHSGVQSAEFLRMQKRLEEMQFRSEVYNIPVASVLEHGYN